MFSVSPFSCNGLPFTVPLVLSLLVDAGCTVGITAFCGTGVGDVGVAELEEPGDKPSATVGTWFPLVLSLLVDAGCTVGITAFCTAGDVGVAELEEPECNGRYVVPTRTLTSC